jgi:hypothetical protein
MDSTEADGEPVGMGDPTGFGLVELRVRGFRSLLDVVFRPGSLSALVGEARAGKSNLLAAIRALLDPAAAPLLPPDRSLGGDGRVRIEARLANGKRLSLHATPPDFIQVNRAGAPPVLSLPAALRSGPVVASSSFDDPIARHAADILTKAIPALAVRGAPSGSETESAHAFVGGLEACRAARLKGLILLIEEPELFLPPQLGRHMYRLLRSFALEGNQVIYSTHSPAFLNVARLEELVFTRRDSKGWTRLIQPPSLQADEEFRAASEFDAERSELLLSRAVVLVEGRTEKHALPFVFEALGHDPDGERISIVECGGKSNLVLFARICKAAGLPYLVVHDRDAPADENPSEAEAALNQLIAEVAGEERTVVLAPDFEAVAGLRGKSRKPERAWLRFRQLEAEEIPELLTQIVEQSLQMAQA